MITRLVSEETVQFIMKKTNDELLWSCQWKVEITGIVLEITKSKSEDAKKIHDEMLSMKRSFNIAWLVSKEIQKSWR
jgi:hypothetical protein